MSGLARRTVAFAANQLPEPERSRRLEEWSADLDGAAEQGVSRAGIAFGAMAVALRSPLPSPVAAGWWAQWALAVSAIGSVVWLSLWTSGLFLSNPAIRDIIEPIIGISTIASLILVVVAGLRNRGVPWIASGAVIMACLTGAVWVVGVSWPIVLVPMLALAAVGLLLVGWRLTHTGTTSPTHRVAVVALVAAPLLVLAIVVTGPIDSWVPIAAASLAIVIALIAAVRSPRADAGAARAGRRAGLIVLAATSAGIIAIAVLVANSIAIAADPASEASTSKLWTRLEPALTLQVGTTVVAVAILLALCAILTAIARRRRELGVNGINFLATAAIASLGTQLPYLVPWDASTAELVVTVIGLLGCVAAVVGIVLLVAPLRMRGERLTEVPVD